MTFINSVPSTRNRAWAEIDLDAALNNFNAVRKYAGVKVCCVIKANAYGHGAVQLARVYEKAGADFFAVSNIEEALQLRQAGITLPVLILGYTSPDCAELLAKNNISQCVFSKEYGTALAQRARESGVRVKVHIKLDTGMGRIGFLCRSDDESELNDAVFTAGLPEFVPEGIFTHFSVADDGTDGEEYTRSQFAEFKKGVEYMESRGVKFGLHHCSNSAAIFDYPEYNLDMVRAGNVLYGLKPSEHVKNLPELVPVLTLRSVISHIKTVHKGESVSYGRLFTAEKDITVATVPIGYADGFRRQCGSGRYSLLVNGKSAPILGRVCMDQLMVDVTGIGCMLGDEVTVFGSTPGNTADDVAAASDTINYEIVCGLGERIPRAYIKDNRIVSWRSILVNHSDDGE